MAYINKSEKKETGKYFTPEDVANLLAEYFDSLDGFNICDVGCGTGNLILAYLKHIGEKSARELIFSNRLFLYDVDEITMNICKQSIGLIYGEDCISHINCINKDFLSKTVILPENCKVVSNPPYFKIKDFDENWIITSNIKESKEYYSAFMEKIIKNSSASVIRL